MAAMTKFDAHRFVRTPDADNPDFDTVVSQADNKILDISNIEVGSDLNRKLTALSKLPEESDIKSFDGQEIELIGFVAKPISQINNDGDIDSYIRFALFGPEGKPYLASSSVGVKNSIEYFLQDRGWGVWEPPIRCKVVITRTSNNHEFHQLMLVQ